MKTNQSCRGVTLIELMILLVIIGLLAMIVLPLCSPIGIAPNFSNGARVGVVTKLSEKGLFFKSWEAEVNMGGFRSQSDSSGGVSAVANVVELNVAPMTIDKVRAAMESGSRVELVYRQWLIKPPTISNRTVITDVRVVR